MQRQGLIELTLSPDPKTQLASGLVKRSIFINKSQ